MIHDVDDALRALIELDGPSGVDISFDAPTREWVSRQNAPIINVFLYDIREDVNRRDVAPQLIRDADGRVVERRPPARRFKLSYLLSAWTQRAEDEHRVLSDLLRQFLRHDAVPDELLTGSLTEGPPVVLQLALPPGQDRSLSDVWTALGGELKPSLDLVVIAPLDPERSYTVGPPVTEEPRVRANATGPAIEPLDTPGDERLSAGVGDDPGRTLTVRRHGRD
ncbi:MAG: DUF4255 domain-containing protein [Actinomycetota bacterium]